MGAELAAPAAVTAEHSERTHLCRTLNFIFTVPLSSTCICLRRLCHHIPSLPLLPYLHTGTQSLQPSGWTTHAKLLKSNYQLGHHSSSRSNGRSMVTFFFARRCKQLHFRNRGDSNSYWVSRSFARICWSKVRTVRES